MHLVISQLTSSRALSNMKYNEIFDTHLDFKRDTCITYKHIHTCTYILEATLWEAVKHVM